MHLNYATNPLWIGLHNISHSLVVVGVVSLLGFFFARTIWGRGLLWFAAGATMHIVIDIFTHAGDGPLFCILLAYLTPIRKSLSQR